MSGILHSHILQDNLLLPEQLLKHASLEGNSGSADCNQVE